MVASPFEPYENSVLNFQVALGALAPDSYGNMRPAKSTIVVRALLEQKRDPNDELRPGVDTTAVWVEGYLVEPRPLPDGVTPDSVCTGTWQGLAGRFYLEFTARNPYLEALDIDLVERIRGYFQPDSFVAV